MLAPGRREGRDLVLTVSAALLPVEKSGGSLEWTDPFFLAVVQPSQLDGGRSLSCQLVWSPRYPSDGPRVLSRLYLRFGSMG